MMKYPIFLCFLIFASCNTAKKELVVSSQVINDTIFSKQLHRPIAYKAYLPPAYNDQKTLPLLYVLHGHGGSDDDWFNPEEGNLQHILDSLIHDKRIPRLVAVTLDAGNTWYVDSKENMEYVYINEFMPYVENKFKVNTDTQSRIIAGNSAGGFGTLRLGLKYPELFQSAILLSPAAYYPLPPDISSSRKIDAFKKDGVFNDSVWQSYTYSKFIDKSNQSISYPKFYTSTGDDDEYQIFKVVNSLHNFFIEHHITNNMLVIDGGHTWTVWRYCFTNHLIRIFKDE